MTEQVTQADFARMCGVSRKTVTKWKARGLLALAGTLVEVEASRAKLERLRRDGVPEALRVKRVGVPDGGPVTRGAIVERLHALDWMQAFDWAPGAVHDRVLAAAKAVGLEVVTSDLDDDGHHGGYQLRSGALIAHHGGPCTAATVAGFGFELDAWDALHACRDALHHPDDLAGDLEDLITVPAELLPALAYPFGPAQKNPADPHH